MGNQKKVEEIARETLNKQWQRRDEYCLRIQKAMQYKGNDDHEDVPSILVDYEEDIKKELIPENAIVITREEYDEFLRQNFMIDMLKDCIKDARKETADRYHEEVNKSIECVPNITEGVTETLKVENKRILFELKSNLL